MATLRFSDDEGNDRTVAVGPAQPEVLVGRNADCLLRTRNNTVSRMHAKVWWADGVYRLRDLDSANGTWCDRRRIKETELADGVELTFGAFPVTFALDPDERAAPPSKGDQARGTAGYEAGALTGQSGGLRDAPTLVDRPALPDAAPRIFVDSDLDVSSPPPVPGTAAFDALPEEIPEAVVDAGDAEPSAPEASPLDAGPGAGADEAESLTLADDFATALSEAQARIVELEQVLADRDASIGRLGLQVEELTNCLGAREDEREAAARQADTEASAAEDARQALAEMRQSLVEVQEQQATVTAERDALMAERDALMAERDALAAERDAPQPERDALATERDALAAERDALTTERDALTSRVAELEAAAQAAVPAEPEDSEARQALADAEEAMTGVQQALATSQEQLAALTAERDAVVLERDALVTERDALVEETLRWDGLKAAFESERSALQGEVERLRPLAEKAGSGPDEALTARVDSLVKELQEAVAEVASLRTANRAYVKRIARLLQDGAVERAEATGTTVPSVGDAPAGANGAADRDAFKASLERINERVSEMRTALDVVSGLLPEVLDRVASDDDEAVEQLRAALDELVSGNREVKSEVVAARQKVS